MHETHGRENLRFGNQHAGIDHSTAHIEGHRTFFEAATGTLGKRRPFFAGNNPSRAQGFVENGRIFGPTSNPLGFGRDPFKVAPDSPDESASAHGGEDRIEVRYLLPQFE